MKTEEETVISLAFATRMADVLGKLIEDLEPKENKYIKLLLKREFNGLLAQSNKAEAEIRKYIKMSGERFAAEKADEKAYYMYQVITELMRFETDEQYIKAISTLKLIR